MMKGYLKTTDGVFQLAPKVTTIGREGCDLVVQSLDVDFQHAVIEFSDQEECFVLQDLNTAQGTYVNDCRVQNAAVRLAPCDVMRFGGSGVPYELQVEAGSHQMAYPPVHQRPAWTQPLTIISDQPPPVVVTNPALPTLKSIINTQTATWAPHHSSPHQAPRPPTSIRSRPLSAGAGARSRPAFIERDRGCSPALDSSRLPYERSQSAGRGPQGGWVTGVHAAPARTITTVPQTADISLMQEKEQRILRLTEEIKRLSGYENDIMRKDEMIRQLRDEIQELQHQLRDWEVKSGGLPGKLGSDQLGQRLGQLEEEILFRNTEISSLREQITRMRGDESLLSMNGISRQDHNDRIMELNSLKTELERVRKDKNITSGLVTQMQRDMASKDTTISRLTRDMDIIKKEIREKDAQLSSMQAKFRRTQETKRSEEEMETKDKDLAMLRQETKASENKMQEHLEIIKALKDEMEKVKVRGDGDREGQKKLQSQLDSTMAKCQDVERSERMVRVDLEQLSKRMERFRNRVIQVTFSTPGIRAPDQEINDDELLDTLKKLMEERIDMQKKVSDMKTTVKESGSAKREFVENSKRIKQHINESLERLGEGPGRSQKVRLEVDLLNSLSLDETVVWSRDAAVQLLQSYQASLADIEGVLEASGVNVKLSEDPLSSHVSQLYGRQVELQTETEALRAQMEESSGKMAEERELALGTLRLELEEAWKAERERLEIEREQCVGRAVEEVRLSEEERHDSALEVERAKVAELELAVETLKQTILEREEEDAMNKEATREALDAIDQYQKLEEELREKIAQLEGAKTDEIIKLQHDLESKLLSGSAEVEGFKIQIQQHSQTICAMEERLNKVVKKNKDYQSEISTLKQTISELRARSARPAAPPKPRVIIQKPAVDLIAMETTMTQLQRDNADLTRQLQEQHDVVLNLRRDLAGASAKLSDMTGELSEAQKQALEGSQKTISHQEVELIELRQQMAKLSHIIDKQATDIKELTDDLGKQRSMLSRYKNQSNERDLRIQELEGDLGNERQEAQKNMRLVEEEGHITSELTAMGAQCRGDRHEQVIARQREALAELRARIKILEQNNPPLPSQDQALQQMVMLKKELAEIRASQALQEGSGGLSILSPLQEHINRTRGIETPASSINVDHERSAHRETMEALEISEQSYLTLLRAMASALELDDISGLRSMSHIPKDERVRLAREREGSTELLTSRVKVLLERIVRKDELLQGYETDLAKLRQAEKLVEQKHGQVESLAEDIRSRTEENQYLRESLHRTKDGLDQEKRLNRAIKTKKTFHLENEQVSKRGWTKHHCPPEDIMGREASKKRATQERLKKKNYEIKTLQSELGTKEKHLHDTRRKLVTLETTMGINGDRDPFEPPSAEV